MCDGGDKTFVPTGSKISCFAPDQTSLKLFPIINLRDRTISRTIYFYREGYSRPMTPELLEKHRDPLAEYRPQYFWYLNHRLELLELKRQLELMKQQGAGGLFYMRALAA